MRLFRTYKPDVVLTWDGFRPSFNHNDHRNTGIAVRDALFPAMRDRLYFPQHAEQGLGEWRVERDLARRFARPELLCRRQRLHRKEGGRYPSSCEPGAIPRPRRADQADARARKRPGGRGLVESFKRVHMRTSQRAQRAEEAQKQDGTASTEAAPGAADARERSPRPVSSPRASRNASFPYRER